MKKAMLGFIATAMSLLSTTANGAGDIRSIDPCDQYGYPIPSGSVEQAYSAGQTAYFRIRLENLNSKECYDTGYSNPWAFQYNGLSLDPALEWVINPPKVGVYVSGQLRGATIESVLPPADKSWYTDIVCGYTVRPGDLALPMTLANSAGKEVGTGEGSEYYLDTIPKSGVWSLVGNQRVGRDDINTPENEWEQIESSRKVQFKIGEMVGNLPGSEIADCVSDFNLRAAGLYLKTVDFKQSEYSVAQGGTAKVGIGIVGGVNTNKNGTVYAMVKAGDAVALNEKEVEVITVPKDPNGEANVDYQVAKVTVPTGAEEFSFGVRGEVQDRQSIVYLSTTKGFSYGDSDDLITNFVTSVVKCTEPEKPHITVTLDGNSRKTVTSGPDYAESAIELNVNLSEAYSSDVAVEVVPTLNDVAVEIGTKYVGMSTYSDGDFAGTNNIVKFTKQEMANGVLDKKLYVYVLGGDVDTAAPDKGVKFIPAAKGEASSFFDNENKIATLFINRGTPTIVNPTEGYTHPEISGGVATAFKIKVADDYMNIRDEYEVEWWTDGIGEKEPNLTGLKANSEGEITVSVTYIGEGEHSTTFRVKNASGAYSDDRHFIVPVRKAKTVKAEVLESPDSTGKYSEEVGELNIRFELSEPYKRSAQPIYAYLVPWNSAASNQVARTGAGFTDGVPILPGQTTSLMDAPVKVLDGIANSLLRFKVVLSSSEQNDGNLKEGFGDYTSQDLYVSIVNKAPIVSSVNMSGSLPVNVSGDTFKGKASIGLNKVFSLVADDVEADLNSEVTVTWNFSDPNGYLFTTNMTGLLSDIKLSTVFEVAGTYDCNVKIKDKDMSASEFAKLAPFDFKVVVSSKPMVLIEFPNSNTFNETDALKGLSYFDVKLSTPASRQIEVLITSVGVEGSSAVMNIVNKSLVFRAGQMSQRVLIDDLDGTLDSISFKGGFTVTAAVTTETVNEDGVRWCDAYEAAVEKIYVANEAPVITSPTDMGVTNNISINVEDNLQWQIDDVDFDLSSLKVRWETSDSRPVETNGATGVFTFKFTSGGTKYVTMTVTDKDGGSSSVTRWYSVAPAKCVHIYPYGPSKGGGLSSVAKKYAAEAEGRGEGRVWADSSAIVSDFVHTYSYSENATISRMYAWGYKVGQVDNGNIYADIYVDDLGNPRDIPLTANGSATERGSTTAYAYKGNLDSFFYAWVISSQEEDSTVFTGTALITPESPTTPYAYGNYSLPLPLSLVDGRPMYPDRFVEAFFSKERYPADNMGDMNADGIPDYYATFGWSSDSGEAKSIAEAMTGVKISSGEEGEGEGATASDLTKVDSYNGDEDFFPAAWSSANPLNPAIKDWGPGLKFTAIDEIRGVGMGLNQPGVSEYELTLAERYALLADFAAAGNVLPGTDEENYAAATNWATSTGWTPEAIDPNTGARLNPLKADTDGDGFDDGWEYFFWYHAKVGAVVNGKWSRLEGRRYSPESPQGFVRISPEEIVEAFNPHVKRNLTAAFGVDFDNDGLTDFEEYILGTNPLNFDMNLDGVLDLYKVMSGIDPTFELYNNGNPDCDFMARCDYAEDTFTVYTFENGEMYALPEKTSSAPVLAPIGDETSVYRVEFESGEIAWFWPMPPLAYNSELKHLSRDVVGFATLSYGGKDYLGGEKVYIAGTAVKSVAEEAVAMQQASVTAFSWIDPVTSESSTTTKALPLFNYGYDGVTYVPCATNVTTYALAPSDSALVRIESKKTITLIHNQVFCQYGFDPRTAWNCDEFGYVDQRWRKTDSSEADGLNAAGFATNTAPYTINDEFFVMQYRQEMRDIDKDGKRSATKSMLRDGDKYLLGNLDSLITVTEVDYLQKATTYPNLPVEFVREWYASRLEVSPFENSTNNMIVAYWNYLEKDFTIHGADTDYDGVPDGWELYVNADPNNTDDAKLRDGWAKDDDNLCILEEYAGVDSCNAYTNRFSLTDPSKLIYPEATTITKNHPGKDRGWWNKFFPTDPYYWDTDGDGVKDDAEGKGGNTDFSVGTTWYGSQKFSFIYSDDDTAEKYSADGSSTCFRGGGLNPCTVDTDGDLLPDGWEYQFAGIVFKYDSSKRCYTNDVPLTDSDLAVVISADGKQPQLVMKAQEGYTHIRGGMDGTFKGDACYDFDHDGLANCQEYLVQSLRHLRYDDSLTPLMGVDPTTKEFVGFIPFCAWDGEAFYSRCKDAGFTGSGAWPFRTLGYFTLPPREWDMLRQNSTGIKNCANYKDFEGAGYRVMLPPVIEVPFKGLVMASGYASTDPRRVDTDYDGMDDYWELFHGLNPILGSYANPLDSGEYGWPNARYDIIAQIHGGVVTSWKNHWTGGDGTVLPALDPIKYPWMMGVMEADADGDGLRNDEEALKVNLANPRNTHTDPTPLWMTDSSSKASYTAQYYNPDPYITGYTGSLLDTYPDLLRYPWTDLTVNERLAADGMGGTSLNWMFAFEENEGYDTDHDFRRDSTELTQGVEMASDPQKHTDLDRRQALYFPGKKSAAVSYGGEFRRSPSTEPNLLRQFTVECWVKPDGLQVGDVTILERVSDYGASTLVNGGSVIRANFRLGIDAKGHIFGEFEGSTADSGSIRVTDNNFIEAGKWTHVAFRFDGVNAHLHVNGEIAPVASESNVGLLPANGIDGIQQTPDQNINKDENLIKYDQGVAIHHTGYRALPCATVLGASVVASTGFGINENTTWNDYARFFKGWLDEVRIWDGARSAAEIRDSYKKAFTMDDIKRMRSNPEETGVFDRWSNGARRSATSGDILPAELLQHYSFSTLPGGVESGNVITEPTGFRSGVLNNIRKPNGGSLDLHTMVGWWYNTPVHSKVYSDYHIVPWIPNTVAHLPFLDGSAPDSQFWAAGIAGVGTAVSMSIGAYEFPNSANPYPYYFYRRDRYNRLSLLQAVESTDSNTVSTTSMYAKWMFDLRSGFVGTSDLVPLGGAYAKRDSDYWDGQGAMDAWTDSKGSALESADSNGDGIPNWAEKLGYVDREAYLRAIAAGLLPNGNTDTKFESTVDANFDGVKDWWQKMYGLAGRAYEDTDKDGLADFAEYLVTEHFFKDLTVSPLLPKTDSVEFDYFRKVGKLYLGEMFSDHDFMEDHLEKEYSEIGASPNVYDAHLDSDDDGWSNWAEVRAKQHMGLGWNATGIVQTNTVYNTYSDYTEYMAVMAKIEANPSTLKLLDTNFDITGYSSFSDSYYGTGYIKYHKYSTVYGVTYLYEGTPVPEVEMTVHYNGIVDLSGVTLEVKAYSGNDLNRCDALFRVRNGEARNVNKLTFKDPEEGLLREGMNTFVVSVATTNTAEMTYSMMGVVRNVDVGWSKVKFDVELTETSPICQRVTIPEGVTNGTSKVYVYRQSVDDIVTPASLFDLGPVVVKDVGNRTYLHEGDFLKASDFDIDWTGFQNAVLRDATVRELNLDVVKVVYGVYSAPVDLLNGEEAAASNKIGEIVREFGETRATAVPVAPGEDSTICYGGQPTFRWKANGDKPDTYTAFAIKVTDMDGKSVWHSGTHMLPSKNSNGEYVWTAPLYVGDQTSLGKVFGSCANYKWSVTMYNSKFQGDSWSAERMFRVNIYGENEPNNAGYYALDVDVKYFGPGAFNADVTKANGRVRIEAFTSPDFSGVPAARTFISDIASVTDSAHVRNVRIVGLAAGTYYVRAYIDSDGDFKHSTWESWGYACNRGDKDTGAIYAPTGFTVGEGIETPFVSLYVEDTDVDQDALPDVWEYDEAKGAEDFLFKKGSVENTNDGYIAVNPDLLGNIVRVTAANSAGGMLSLAASGYMPSAMAAMMLGVDSVEPEIEEGTLGITAFSLDGDTVKLTVGAKADDPLAGSVFVSNGKITATVVVLHATSLAEGFAELKSVDVTFDIEEGAVSHTESISLKDILGEDVDLSKGFFKVELK